MDKAPSHLKCSRATSSALAVLFQKIAKNRDKGLTLAADY
jgi:hypothetical protein